MKVELDLKRRATLSELCRREAAALRSIATSRTMSDATKEMNEHASYLEETADSLMRYSFEAEKSAASLIERTPDVDIITPVPNGRTS